MKEEQLDLLSHLKYGCGYNELSVREQIGIYHETRTELIL